MRYLIIILLFVLIISGCSSEKSFVELNKETLSQLNPNEIIEVYLVSTMSGEEPEKWRRIYTNTFPIEDLKGIKIVLNYIYEGEHFDYDTTGRYLVFETKNTIYYIGIGWDSEKMYGDDWLSPQLLQYFIGRGFEFPKGKKNLPKGALTVPHYERDPNMGG